jgi:hypothetical protein
MVPPIGTPLLAGPTVPRAATLELVPSSPKPASPDATPLTTPCVATSASTLTRRVALVVPPASWDLDDSYCTTCGPGGSCRILRSFDDSCLSSAAPWSSTAGVAFFTDHLRLSSMSACGSSTCDSDGTCTSNFDDDRAPTYHGSARDSPNESSLDGHTCQGWFPDASRAPHPRRHDHLDAAVSNPDICLCCTYQSKLVCGYGGRVQGLNEQWNLGTCFPASWIQHRHQQIDIHVQVSLTGLLTA